MTVEFIAPNGKRSIVGRGCGCALCAQPLPYVEPMTPEEAAALNAAYAAPRPKVPKGRGRGQRRVPK